VPYVVSPRGMLVRDLIARKNAWAKRAWIALVERATIKRASAIHVTSALEAREISELGLTLPRVFQVPNGVTPLAAVDEDAPLPSIVHSVLASGRPVVLYVGRVNWKKGIDRLIRAITQLPEAMLLIIGDDEGGEREALEALAAEEGVRHRVVFGGGIYGAAKAQLYRRASVLVLPSLSENFGNVVLEAMLWACPVVVTPQVGAAEVVREAEAGVIAAGDPESLRMAIGSLIVDPNKRAVMGHRGRELVTRKYGWEAIAARMISAYRECLIAKRHVFAGNAPNA